MNDRLPLLTQTCVNTQGRNILQVYCLWRDFRGIYYCMLNDNLNNWRISLMTVLPLSTWSEDRAAPRMANLETQKYIFLFVKVTYWYNIYVNTNQNTMRHLSNIDNAHRVRACCQLTKRHFLTHKNCGLNVKCSPRILLR